MRRSFKLLLLSIALLFLKSSSLYAQVFYSSFGKPKFDRILTHGITYLRSGDEEKDKLFSTALDQFWTVSKFQLLDPTEPESNLQNEDIVLTVVKLENGEDFMCLIPYSIVLAGSGSKYSTVGYISFAGFDRSADFKPFINQIVIGLHDCVETINANKITGKGAGLYNAVTKAILPKSKQLKGKTLIILEASEKRINTSMLEKEGIKFKVLTVKQYAELFENDDLSNYCLFYFSYGSFTEVSFFDLEKNELIYTKHFINGCEKFGAKDFSAMKKQMIP